MIYIFGAILATTPLNTLSVIEDVKRFIDTGDKPIQVTCDDLNDYYCKYRDTQNLLKEYLASRFLDLWQIPTPEIAFVEVKRENVPEKLWRNVPLRFFDQVCFGSAEQEETFEVSAWLTFLESDPYEARKIQDPLNFLKICLFDIWLSNEDRHAGNYNMLLVPHLPNQFHFYAIDHSSCFNSSRIGEYPLSLLTYDDSLISSPICKVLYRRKRSLNDYVDLTLEQFHENVNNCMVSIPEILRFVPPSWNIDTVQLETALLNSIFEDGWLVTVEHTFREYLQYTFR